MSKKNLLLPAIFILLFGFTFASTVTRSFSATTVQPGADLTVTLTVDITAAETYYAIDEVLPSGWTVKSYEDTGSAEHAGHLKWVDANVTDAADTPYTYVVTAPSQSGTADFSGIFMFEGMEIETPISGQTRVTVAAVCTIDNDCQSNQFCCSNVCVTPACSADGDCPAGQVCINPNECNASCSITGCTADSQCPTGQICCNPNCVTPGCIDDSGCNDNDDSTTDKCNNANTCTAQCTHEPIVIKPPVVIFQQIIEVGKTQTITLTTEDGTPIADFNVLITFPDKTTAKFTAINGIVAIPIGAAGTFNGTAQTAGHEVPFSFEAKAPLPPPIPPETKDITYLIIWLLAIIVISGLLMAITRLKPLWFRVFMATSYTALPFAVRYYLQNMEIALATIAIQTTVLTALWFRQWKKEKLGQKKEQVEWKQTSQKETPPEKKQQPSSGETTEKGWSELQRELDRITEEKKAQAAEKEEESADEGDWEEFAK